MGKNKIAYKNKEMEKYSNYMDAIEKQRLEKNLASVRQ